MGVICRIANCVNTVQFSTAPIQSGHFTERLTSKHGGDKEGGDEESPPGGLSQILSGPMEVETESGCEDGEEHCCC